eukprot:scaffold66047_cov17-Prasinocladus_malaysianus.AAC.1
MRSASQQTDEPNPEVRLPCVWAAFGGVLSGRFIKLHQLAFMFLVTTCLGKGIIMITRFET